MPSHRKVSLKFLFYSSELVWILFIKKDICFTELLAQILLFYEQIAARKKDVPHRKKEGITFTFSIAKWICIFDSRFRNVFFAVC